MVISGPTSVCTQRCAPSGDHLCSVVTGIFLVVAARKLRLGRVLSIVALTVAGQGCSSSTDADGPTSEYLGVFQVRVSYIEMPDSIAATDTLHAYLLGATDVGDCLSLSHVVSQRDSFEVAITMWAEARRWLGSGPPPPCGTVGYRYDGAPPFFPGWFSVIANQPDSTVFADSLRVVG
jgi:hypothetical protein